MQGTSVDQVLDELMSAEEDEPDVVDDQEDGARPAEVAETEACGQLDDLSSEALTEQAEEDPAAAISLVTVSALDGVPLFFARGVPLRPQSFSIEPGFRDVLVRTVKSVRARAPESFGNLVRITSAGAFVAKPGLHGQGRAFDHDAWTFEHVDIRPIRHDHDSDSRPRRQRYWALAAIIRSHSAFILHGHFNAAHEDHIHQDNAAPRPFSTSSETTVKLAQAICNHIYGESPALAIDGAFGVNSKSAVHRAMVKAGFEGDAFDPTQWSRFLRRSGRLGFRLSMRD